MNIPFDVVVSMTTISYNLCWRQSGCVPCVFHDNYIHTIFVGGTVGVCHVFAMLVTEYSCHGNNPKLQQQKEVGEAY